MIEPAPKSDRSGGRVDTTTGLSGAPSTGGGAVEGAGSVEPAMPDPADRAGVTTEAAPRASAGTQDAAIGIDAGTTADDLALVGPDASSVVPTTDMIAPPELDARIIRSGSIELRVKRAGFEDAWGDAQAVAAAHGGYVIGASRSGAGDGPRAGTISMRIPTGRFDAAVDRVREVSGAKVRRLDVTSQDVTQEFVDVRSRLRHDRAVEARLLALLAQTRGVSEVLAVSSRLDQVQEQIELSKGRLGYLEKMTSMSTIEVAITAPAKAGTKVDEGEDDAGVLSQSLADARDRFEGNVAGAIVWFGGALPTLVLLAMVAFAGRTIWRRTRPHEAPRDPATPSG